MFPLSHIYVSTKVAEKESDLLVLGSVIPDLAWFSESLRNVLHNTPSEFWDFVKDKYPDSLDLALGVKLHSQINKGADYYSDDDETGYAKVNGRKIIKIVTKALGIEEGQQALVLSHNFIEAAIDLLLAESVPSLPKVYRRAIDSEANHQAAIVVSAFLDKEVALVDAEMKKLFDFLSPENISFLMGVCSNAVAPFLERTLGKKLNLKQILNVLKKSKELINDSYLSFLNETVKKMKIDFQDYI
ncbi:hypothetical protein COT64_00800 [Candidatus Shapirobacteria bacterium CG09_land_8_20_14_0_10_39_12]|uniref:Uncharacterized protein n=1 Tax=Candidatus Shapirobacteria bacterium CG09_land_8_20_14_0_10_39_12 TaxID=1974885 RepID=A0A2H0WQ49_9BACT|nr:MAG: hypothetical protein COT64_00800 [Candidatus Shapirobacteria bacterium CG09_land_8_20_14_0_10_39_12]